LLVRSRASGFAGASLGFTVENPALAEPVALQVLALSTALGGRDSFAIGVPKAQEGCRGKRSNVEMQMSIEI
jgi:hypothetical protein